MPTSHRRIAVILDDELRSALERARGRFDGAPAARVVHDLAVKGAEALEREEEERAAAIKRLIELSTQRGPAIDWEVLEHVEETAWGE